MAAQIICIRLMGNYPKILLITAHTMGDDTDNLKEDPQSGG